jgi:hypothetical protein
MTVSMNTRTPRTFAAAGDASRKRPATSAISGTWPPAACAFITERNGTPGPFRERYRSARSSPAFLTATGYRSGAPKAYRRNPRLVSPGGSPHFRRTATALSQQMANFLRYWKFVVSSPRIRVASPRSTVVRPPSSLVQQAPGHSTVTTRTHPRISAHHGHSARVFFPGTWPGGRAGGG